MKHTDHKKPIRWTTELFIEESNKIHNNKYTYTTTVYKDTMTPVEIECPKHGFFFQKPVNHLQGKGCCKCGLTKNKQVPLGLEEFKKRAMKVHGYKYSYTSCNGLKTPVEIICPEHGSFIQSPGSHLAGRGCPECGKRTMGQRKWTPEKFLIKAREYHNDKYSYEFPKYFTLLSILQISCPIHGLFTQLAKSHIDKRSPQGCPECGKLKSIKNRTHDTEVFIKRAKAIHGDKYDYSKVNYKNAHGVVEIICLKHGAFFQKATLHLIGKHGCPSCNVLVSKGETAIADWIESLGFQTVRSNRKILKGKELDIYISEKQLAIEHNGLYVHSTARVKDKRVQTRHMEKHQLCQELGIRLIQIWDVEWEKRQTACKDIISFALGKIEKRIYARKCEIRKVETKESNAFLEKYHIQGKSMAHYRIGLYFENELVGQQCYIKNVEGEWTLARTSFKVGCQIIGGLSRMFKYFVKNNNPDKIVVYTDLRLFTGSSYNKLCFRQEGLTSPENYLTDGHDLYTNRHYRHVGKRHFKYKMPWDEVLTDTENLENNGWYWVWDAGKLVNVWTKS